MSKKSEIMISAARLFAEKGFKGTSTAAIAAAAGVAESTVFYHFGTKEGVFLSLLKNWREEMRQELGGLSQGDGPPRQGLARLLEAVAHYCRLSGFRPDMFQVLHRSFPHELAAVNRSCRDCLEGLYEGVVDLFESAIRSGQHDGSIVPGSARKMALIVFAMADGFVRFHTHRLYDPGPLFNGFLASIRRMLGTEPLDALP